MKKLEIKNNKKGVTLIALVVTIIVIIILTGIGLTMIAGDSNIARKVGDATDTKARSEDDEILNLAILRCYDKTGNLDLTKLNTELQKEFPGATITGTSFPVTIVTANKMKYTINGEGETTKVGMVTDTTTQEITQANMKNYYGYDVVGYETQDRVTAVGDGKTIDWQLFYVGKIDDTDPTEQSHIYLISKDYVEKEYLPKKNNVGPLSSVNYSNYRAFFSNEGANDGIIPQYSTYYNDNNIMKMIQKYNKSWYNYSVTTNGNTTYPNRTSEKMSIKMAAYMLDTSVWNKYAGQNAEYAIGGPSIEILFKAYNQYAHNGNNTYQTRANNTSGYNISADSGAHWAIFINDMIERDTASKDSPYIVSGQDKALGYWVSSPMANSSDGYIGCVLQYAGIGHNKYNYAHYGFRPIVCLNTDVSLEETTVNGKIVLRIVK